MAYDGATLHSVVFDLNNKLKNGKIEKVYQPEKDELLINIRNNKTKYKLLISASSNNPRVYLTNHSKENPLSAPSFSMLLRKHIENGRILNFSQYEMDRILKIDILSRDELGYDVVNSLIVEIMGKYSNIILINNETNIIYDSIKRVNNNMSRVREILPGLKYNSSSISNKINPLEILKDDFIQYIKNSSPNKSIRNFLINTFNGIGTLLAREIIFKSQLDETRILSTLSENDILKITSEFLNIMNLIKENKYNPILIYEDNKLKDFSIINLELFSEKEKKYIEDISELLDFFYVEKDNKQRIDEKSKQIKKIIMNNLEKLNKKTEKQTSELNEALDREKYKIFADLLSANILKIKKGMKEIVLENFYKFMMPITIPLDIKLDGPQNANKYYKKYSKLKNAAKFLTSELEKDSYKIKYLNSLSLNIELSENSNDINEIKNELASMGYIKKKTKKKEKIIKSKYLEYKTEDDFIIYAGKNNKQNDELTLKLANKDDYWFHVKTGAGSHVILKNNGKEFSQSSIMAAASIAALNSSYKNSTNIEVDYTLRKFVKKHPAKIPGLVNYVNYKTILIKNIDDYLENVEKLS